MDAAMEAAKWVARLQRPDSARFHDEFEAWLDAAPMNRQAYEKAVKRFDGAQLLSKSDKWPTVGIIERSSRRRKLVTTLLPVLIGTIGLWLALSHWPASRIVAPHVAGHASRNVAIAIDNPPGAIMQRKLADGSRATLDTDSRARLVFTGTERNIWLDRGRARFTVAHDGRPFLVHAGDSTVKATGTIFDVTIAADGAVTVALLQGSVEVRDGIDMSAMPHRMSAGQSLSFAVSSPVVTTAKLNRRDGIWTEGLMEFDAAPLAKVVEAANRYGGHIRLEGSDLAGIAVSGRFRIDMPERLAANLAKSLNLVVAHGSDGTILLHR